MVEAPWLERIMQTVDFDDSESLQYFQRVLIQTGVIDALREAGIAYAIDQIADLIAGGVDGIHLYTMNNPDVAKQIAGSIDSIRKL